MKSQKSPPKFALYLLPIVGIVCCSIVAFVTVYIERQHRPPVCPALHNAPVIHWDRKQPVKCEGYWASEKNDESGLPWPKEHATPFPDTDRFVAKLRRLERYSLRESHCN